MNSEHDALTYAQRAAMADTAGDRDRAAYELVPASPEPVDRRPVIATRRDAFNVLAYIAAFDSRVRGEHEAQAWLDALAPHRIPIEDARAAVAAYFSGQDRHRWITPGDLIFIIEEGL